MERIYLISNCVYRQNQLLRAVQCLMSYIKNWDSCQTLDSQGWVTISRASSQAESEDSGYLFPPGSWLIMGPNCFSASFHLLKPRRFEYTCPVRVAVVRGRERFLIVVLWPKPHVKALGGLTQMRWGPADCSATLGGCLAYSFSVVIWPVLEVVDFRKLVLLFLKGEGRGGVRWSGVPPATLPSLRITSNPPSSPN